MILSMKVTIHHAKTNLSKLIREAVQGSEVIIARGDVPLVRLIPIETTSPKRTVGRYPSLLVSMAPDFDAPLDDLEPYAG